MVNAQPAMTSIFVREFWTSDRVAFPAERVMHIIALRRGSLCAVLLDSPKECVLVADASGAVQNALRLAKKGVETHVG